MNNKLSPLRVLFAGTPDFSVPTLAAMVNNPETIRLVGVLTNPDAPGKRGKTLKPSPVSQFVQEHAEGVAVLKPQRLDQAVRDAVVELQPDILVCVAYGRIFGPKFLALFPRGGINLHPSLLPQFRGPSPLQAAILAGLHQTGITVQYLSQKMDAGDILLQEPLALVGDEYAHELLESTASRGAKMVLQVLQDLQAGLARPEPQDHSKATYCRIITKEDGLITWSDSSIEIHRRVRAYRPWPGAYTYWKGLKLTIHAAVVYNEAQSSQQPPGSVLGIDKKSGILVQTGDGQIALQSLQLQSKKQMDFKSFVNGVQDFLGSHLGGIHE